MRRRQKTATVSCCSSLRISALIPLCAVIVVFALISPVSGQSTAEIATQEIVQCVQDYRQIFDSFLSHPQDVVAICPDIEAFTGCLANAVDGVDLDSSTSLSYTLSFAQTILVAVLKEATCDTLENTLWETFIPDTEVTAPAVWVNTSEYLNCVFAPTPTSSERINLALASGFYNRPEPGVVGMLEGCTRQDRCDNLFRVNPCFELLCGPSETSAACSYRVFSSYGGVTAFTNTNIGNTNTRSVAFRTSDSSLRLEYRSVTPFDNLPISPSVIATFFGLPLDDQIVNILGSVQSLHRTRAYFVCDPTANALPRMEPVAQPRQAGILNEYSFEIRHRCACPNAVNCTGPMVHTKTGTDCITNTVASALSGLQFLFVIPFVLLEARVQTKPRWFRGFIGVPYPVNFLESRSQRIISALLFTVFASTLFTRFFSLAFSASTATFVGTIQTLGIAFLTSMSMYPVFLAATCRFVWFGSLIGILACLLLVYDSISISVCFQGTISQFLQPISVMQSILLTCTLLGFTYRLYRDVRLRVEGRLSWTEPSRKDGTSDSLKHLAFYETRVREILQKRSEAQNKAVVAAEKRTVLQILKDSVREYLNIKERLQRVKANVIQRATEGFRLGTRVLAAGLMSIVWTILFASLLSLILPLFIELVSVFVLNTGADLRCRALPGYILFPNQGLVPASFSFRLGCKTNETILTVVQWVIFGAGILTSLTQLGFITSLFFGHRRRLRGLARGDKHVLPHKLPTPAVAISQMVKYLGYQIAHMYIGWILLFGLYFLILAIIAVFVVLPLLDILPRSWLYFWGRQLNTLLFGLVFVYLQKLLVRFVFLITPRSLAIRNRNWFHNFDFFSFVFNAVAGAFLFIQRFFLTAILSLLFISRLDVTSLPRGYEGWDSSYSVYVGTVVVDAFYGNAVLITFVRLLIEGRPNYSGDLRHKRLHVKKAWDAEYALNSSENDKELLLLGASEEVTLPKPNHAARNRWFLALTLHRNPGLRLLRRQHEADQKERPVDGGNDKDTEDDHSDESSNEDLEETLLQEELSSKA
eukprot:m.169874 g.169874  ORF g.169874 m.169874 type:complete len:1044 (+) comp16480_c0_seq2:91-3222(+)